MGHKQFLSEFKLAGRLTFTKMTLAETLEATHTAVARGNSPSPPLPSSSTKSKDNLGRVKKKKTKIEIVPDSKF